MITIVFLGRQSGRGIVKGNPLIIFQLYIKYYFSKKGGSLYRHYLIIEFICRVESQELLLIQLRISLIILVFFETKSIRGEKTVLILLHLHIHSYVKPTKSEFVHSFQNTNYLRLYNSKLKTRNNPTQNFIFYYFYSHYDSGLLQVSPGH